MHGTRTTRAPVFPSRDSTATSPRSDLTTKLAELWRSYYRMLSWAIRSISFSVKRLASYRESTFNSQPHVDKALVIDIRMKTVKLYPLVALKCFSVHCDSGTGHVALSLRAFYAASISGAVGRSGELRQIECASCRRREMFAKRARRPARAYGYPIIYNIMALRIPYALMSYLVRALLELFVGIRGVEKCGDAEIDF
ncbi:hypothetical protein EVAR_49981_1 [Eumeta japonica]|uniref:Uncharacterized protein n=1 Tax=Eumeta variegata TaxID=151549 RepID=A0A4C1YMD9_EUMVA|nr:hypothetical protein EVAR_49981_1 [Eumeta japonica]